MALEEGKVNGEESNKPTENKSEEQVTISKHQLDQLFERLENLEKEKSSNSTPVFGAEALALVAKELAKVVKGSNGESYSPDMGKYSYTDVSLIDSSDLLEEPVVFYTYSGGYVIVDDKKNNEVISTPFRRPIFLRYFTTKRYGQGKEQNLFHIATYTCRSKKELEFLRNHQYFNSMFFEQVPDVSKNVDMRMAKKLSKHITALNNIDAHRVLQMAKENNVVIEQDINDTRLGLATVLANKEMKKEADASARRNELALRERFVPQETA